MNKFYKLLIFTLSILYFANTSVAHHSAVVFDETTSIQKTGVVTRFIMRNPHMIIIMEVENDNGEKEVWSIEGQGIAAMRRAGFTQDAVAAGDTVTIKMRPLKSGNPGGLIQGMIGADGTRYAMGGEGDAPEPETARLVYPALMPYEAPPEGETWQIREEKTRPPALPIVSDGTAAGDSTATGLMPGALDPANLAMQRPEPGFDITGVWQFRGEDNWRANYGSFEFKPSPEFTAKGEAYHDAYLVATDAGGRGDDPTAYCYPAGMPRMMTRYGSMMMLQYPTAIFMVSRLNNEYRVIFLDGRERGPADLADPNWAGESIGHWEGNTLVVETTGFIGENHLIQAGVKTGEQLRIIERISMINDGNTLMTEYTFIDPEYWVGEWTHTKFRDRVLRSDVREANCLFEDTLALPGL